MPDLADLARSDAASRAMALAWQRAAPARYLADTFAGIGPDDPDPAAVAAERVLADASWAAALLEPLVAALAADPWFQPPFRVTRDRLRTSAVVFDRPVATLTATVLSADVLATLPPPDSVVASGRRTIVRYVRAGGARLLRWDVGSAGTDFAASHAPAAVPLAPVPLADDMVLTLDGRRHAHVLGDAADDVVTLTFTIRSADDRFVREYALSDGALVRSAAIDDGESRAAMLLALLRVSGRRDAAAVFEAATDAPSFALRWSAMREWLALDARAALPRLDAMRDDPNAEVRHAAAITFDQLARACRG